MRNVAKRRSSRQLRVSPALLACLLLGLGPSHVLAESSLGPQFDLQRKIFQLPDLKIDPHGQTNPEAPPSTPSQQPGQGPPGQSPSPQPDCSAACTFVCHYQGKC